MAKHYIQDETPGETIPQLYSRMWEVLEVIHDEEQAVFAASYRASLFLDRCTRITMGIEKQGYSNEPGCSAIPVYSIATTNQPGDLSIANEPHSGASLLVGLEQAESSTRSVFAGSHSQD